MSVGRNSARPPKFFARQNMYEFPRQSENLSSRVPPTDFASFLQANHGQTMV